MGVLSWVAGKIGGDVGKWLVELLAGWAALHWIDTHPGLFITIIGAALMGYTIWKAPAPTRTDEEPGPHPLLHLVLVLIFNLKYLWASAIAFTLVIVGVLDMTGIHRFVDDPALPPAKAKVEASAPASKSSPAVPTNHPDG